MDEENDEWVILKDSECKTGRKLPYMTKPLLKLFKSYLKAVYALICAAQEQAIRIKCLTYRVDDAAENDINFRIC